MIQLQPEQRRRTPKRSGSMLSIRQTWHPTIHILTCMLRHTESSIHRPGQTLVSTHRARRFRKQSNRQYPPFIAESRTVTLQLRRLFQADSHLAFRRLQIQAPMLSYLQPLPIRPQTQATRSPLYSRRRTVQVVQYPQRIRSW